MTLPEVPETAATGSVAETYADIRTRLGAPMVNLVYRHMATVPGCLDWAWACLRPGFDSGDFHRQAARLVEHAPAVSVPPFSVAVLRDAGIDATAAAAIAGVLDAYGRVNPLSVIALQLLSLVLVEGFDPGDGAPSETIRSSPQGAAEPPPALPPLVDVSTVDTTTAAMLGRLAAQVGVGGGVVPTAYRHVAHWPGFPGAHRRRHRWPRTDGRPRAGDHGDG